MLPASSNVTMSLPSSTVTFEEVVSATGSGAGVSTTGSVTTGAGSGAGVSTTGSVTTGAGSGAGV